MKAVILAGGYGTRISEESGIRPKPMVEIGGKPILWHIMKIYAHHGIKDFIICCGYKSEVIKNYFTGYLPHQSDITVDLANREVEIHNGDKEDWKVTLVETGENTMTGGRLKRVEKYIGNEPFCMTYGDGVSDVNIAELIEFHKKQKTLATVTAVKSPGRFGAFALEKGQTKVARFREKHTDNGVWINGGFFVLEPEVMKHIQGDETVWEREPMQRLAEGGGLSAFRHTGFWHPMDTLRDKNVLEDIWASGKAPWKLW
ncbi:MAG: glucose-1-phosphate cytidylyltransferase [Candidatus Yanofskybacteria bacterium]|nr:glucose-1-phosphate cytidylyltransferase [Candidatus Yanofskybacteria bacterium]